MMRVRPYGPWLDGAERTEAWLDPSLVASAWYASGDGRRVLGVATSAGVAYVQPDDDIVQALGLRGLPPPPPREVPDGR